MKHDLGTIVIECSKYFTVDVQPIRIDKELVYAISQYGTDEVFIVRDEDYPDLALPEWCVSEFIPMGCKKAAALTGILHAENIKKYGIKDVEENVENYCPKNPPYYAYLKSTGKRIRFFYLVLRHIANFIDTKFFRVLSSIVGYLFLYAIGGALLAPFYGGHPCIGMIVGPLVGIFFWLLGLLDKYVLNPE